jgi:acetyl/propionyl-CoA carboxylase alpha subunit
MSLGRLLVANRGEVAIRVARAAGELGVRTVGIYSEDDSRSRHVLAVDEALPLRGAGAVAYLDAAQIIEAGRRAGCDAVHPGYGFLSESAAFARACGEAGLTFVGPSPEVLALFGDKVRARALAYELGVPLLAGTAGPTTLEEASRFFTSLGDGGAVMVKALAGGGGRGIRPVEQPGELAAAFARCASEARASFGNGDLYVERWIRPARHIEVQVVGDGSGAVTHLGERECTLQRRHQKLMEIAPSPWLPVALRRRLTEAALRLGGAARFGSLGTFEFLIDLGADPAGESAFTFLEANPRLQVEHTITEEVTGIDLVQLQLRLAGGASLADLRLTQNRVPEPVGCALQLRINMETLDARGEVRPSRGALRVFEPPSGPGIRVDTYGYAGYTVNPAFDSLLAKLVVHARTGGFEAALIRARRALAELRIEGVDTNVPLLQGLLEHPDVAADRLYTRFIDDHLAELARPASLERPQRFFGSAATAAEDSVLPLTALAGPEGTTAVVASMSGRVVAIEVSEGAQVGAEQPLIVVEAMKMEQLVTAPAAGTVRDIVVTPGDQILQGQPVLFLVVAGEAAEARAAAAPETDPDHLRPDLVVLLERLARGLDEKRPDAVAKRRKSGQRTARENVEDLCDPGSFIEVGALAIAA